MFGRRRTLGPRRGPGLIGTMARTAVIAGTATAAANAVGGSAHRKQQEAVSAATAQQQANADLEEMKAQLAAVQVQQAQAALPTPPAVPAGGTDILGQLQQLAQLKEAGMLTDEEFAAAKAKLLGS